MFSFIPHCLVAKDDGMFAFAPTEIRNKTISCDTTEMLVCFNLFGSMGVGRISPREGQHQQW